MKKSNNADAANHTKVFVRSDIAIAVLDYMQEFFGNTSGVTDSSIAWAKRQIEDTEDEFVELVRLVPPSQVDSPPKAVKVKRPGSKS